MTNVAIIGTIIGFPCAKIKWVCQRGVHELDIIKIRRQQSKNPSGFLTLAIDRVQFNPKAFERKEQDYLELDLSVISQLLADKHLNRLMGYLSIDGSQPEEEFEILNDLVFRKSGQESSWAGIKVSLSKEMQEYLSLRRKDGNSVVIAVNLIGYQDKGAKLELGAFTRKLLVPKL